MIEELKRTLSHIACELSDHGGAEEVAKVFAAIFESLLPKDLREYLTNLGADISKAMIGNESSILMIAAGNGQYSYVQERMKDYRDKKSLLRYASIAGDLQMMTILLDVGVKPDPDALCSALFRGNLEAARLLISRGADIRNRGYYNPWSAVNDVETAQFLTSAGCPMDDIFRSVRTSDVEVLRFLLDNRADIATFPMLGRVSDISCLRLLLERGLKVDNSDLLYSTCCQRPNGPIIRLLLTYSADPNKGLRPPALAVAEYHNIPISKTLLAAGANFNSPSILKEAIKNLAYTKWLVSTGVNVNVQDYEGYTPLDFAAGVMRKYLRSVGAKTKQELAK